MEIRKRASYGSFQRFNFQFSSAQSLSRVELFPTDPMGCMSHARLPCPSPAPRACTNSCSSSQWCYPTISSSAIHFSSCPQPFPSSGSFSMSQFFATEDQSIGASASALVLSMNIQNWFPLGLTGLIFLLFKGLSGVFSHITVQEHQFFGTQLSLWSNSHIHTWLPEKS